MDSRKKMSAETGEGSERLLKTCVVCNKAERCNCKLTEAKANVLREISGALAWSDPYLRYQSEILDECIDRMKQYGGSFVVLLAELYGRSDGVNQRKILTTWPHYFLEYAE